VLLLKLLVLGTLLYLVAGRFSRWTLNKLLQRTHMDAGQRTAIASLVHHVVLVVHLDRTIRLRVPVSVAQGSDVRLVERVLLEVARAHPEVQPEPPPDVALVSLGGASIGLELHVWYDGRQCAKQQVLSGLYFALTDALKAHEVKLA